MQQNHEALLFNFIKSKFDTHAFIIPDKVIFALSSDIEFKIHEIAKLTRNIMLQAKRNYSKPEDINSALNLSFSNLLLVSLGENKTDERKFRYVEDNKIILNVFSSSPPITFYKLSELNSVSKNVYMKLMKSIFDRDEETVKFAMSIIRQKYCLNEVLIIIISTLNDKIDQRQEEEFLLRVVMILENIIENKSLVISENPLRDLCISLACKLLMSAKNFNMKLRLSEVLKNIIRRQYLLRHIINKMIIDKLLDELNQPFLSCDDYSGCLIGLANLDYGASVLSEEFISSLYTFPSAIVDSPSMKNAVAYFLHKTSIQESLYDLPYNKVQTLVDIFFGFDSFVLYVHPICDNNFECRDSNVSSPDNFVTGSNACITPYDTITHEIDLLLHGSTVDDLKSSNLEQDDMPPVLFRKSFIQTQLSGSRHTVEEMGFFTKPISCKQRLINISISGVSKVSEEPQDPKDCCSEFYKSFHRCHQFIVNSKTLNISKAKSSRNSRNQNRHCAMYNLFFVL